MSNISSGYKLVGKLTIGKGEQGIQGIPGKDGKDGIDGIDGKNGLSAYEVWISEGNAGTEQDFINSLKVKGDKGETGDNTVKVSNTEPTEESIEVWFDTSDYESGEELASKIYVDNTNKELSDRFDKLLTDSIDSTKIELNNNINTSKLELNDNINAARIELNKNINTVKSELNDKVDTTKSDLNKSIDATKLELNNKIDTTKSDLDKNINANKKELNEKIDVNTKEINKSKTDYFGKEHTSLNERLTEDFDNIHQKVNDSSYLPYEGSNIKADNSYYGLTKDLSVKGRTLQNLFNGGKEVVDLSLTTATKSCVNSTNVNMYKPNTVYTVIINVKQNTIVDDSATIYKSSSHLGIFPNATVKPSAIPTGIYMYKLTTVDDFTGLTNAFRMPIIPNGATEGVFEVDEVLILEGDHTNTPLSELPFGEGIYSVGESEVTSDGKYPVKAKSTGKNIAKIVSITPYENGTIELVEKNKYQIYGSSAWKGGSLRLEKPMIEGKSYIISFDVENIMGNEVNFILFTNIYKVFSSNIKKFNFKFTSTKTEWTIPIVTHSGEGKINVTNIQIEEVDPQQLTSTPYEPYQESPLEYLLDEPLRSLPNGVRDTIEQRKDGVYHIQRIDKVTLDGSEVWNSFSTTSTDYNESILPVSTTAIKNNFNTTNSICSNVPQVYNHRVVTQGNVYFRMPKANATTLDEFKAWLQANPTTVYYELAEPIITQLEPQQLFSFEGTTHIASDNYLMPIISTKIASNVQAVVSSLMNENKELTKEVSTLNIENEELKNTNNVQDELIDINMFATDEMYVMLEPLLKSIPQTLNVEGEVRNPMVDLYVAMVMRGLKTIDEVPARYREEVARILAELEK